jgi:hypothetical protein
VHVAEPRVGDGIAREQRRDLAVRACLTQAVQQAGDAAWLVEGGTCVLITAGSC